MVYIIQAASILIVFVTLSVVLLQFVFLLDVVFGGHDFPTSKSGIKQVGKILAEFKKDTGILYDLGSARGNFAVRLPKYSPNLKVFGVDNSKLRIFCSRLRAWVFKRQAEFIHGDIFELNVSKADAVYIYLDQSLMLDLQNKLQKELKPGAMVITNTQSFPNWQPAKIYITSPKKPAYEKMFVYIKR